jgi:hypothetical protein
MRQRRWLELIKNYELEVHYHPRKANVVVDALSHKAHCNYLPVIRLTEEESSTQVLPNLYLFNITLTPTLRDEIIAAQKDDERMGHILRGECWKVTRRSLVFARMRRELYDSRRVGSAQERSFKEKDFG